MEFKWTSVFSWEILRADSVKLWIFCRLKRLANEENREYFWKELLKLLCIKYKKCIRTYLYQEFHKYKCGRMHMTRCHLWCQHSLVIGPMFLSWYLFRWLPAMTKEWIISPWDKNYTPVVKGLDMSKAFCVNIKDFVINAMLSSHIFTQKYKWR